ncbi:unnamed protein product [Closterium sp. NIES-53]
MAATATLPQSSFVVGAKSSSTRLRNLSQVSLQPKTGSLPSGLKAKSSGRKQPEVRMESASVLAYQSSNGSDQVESWTDPSMVSPAVTQQKIESWLQHSAADIIRHLDDAPFFHLVFDGVRGFRSPVRQRLPQGIVDHADSWSSVRQAVQNDDPDGLILVHRLDESDLSKRYGHEMSGELEELAPPSNPCQTNVWGLVVLGRASHRHACYILKTTRCSAASSLSATRFSITRAKCFGASVHKQLEQAWLNN